MKQTQQELKIREEERQRLRDKIKSKNINGVYLLDNQVEALLKLLSEE